MKAYALPRHPRDVAASAAAAAASSSPNSSNTTTSTNRNRTKSQQQPKIQLSMSESSENAVAASSPRSRTTPMSVTSSSSASKSKVSYTKGSSRIPAGSSKMIKGKGKSKSRTRKWGSSSLASNAAPQLTEEQMTFENKLCLDEQGLIINKIDRHGKAQLRYVRCMSLVAWNKTKKRNFASRSTGALNARHAHYFNGSRSTGDFYTNTLDDTQNLLHTNTNPRPAAPVRNSATGKMNPSEYVLVWGKHPSHCIPLDRFQCITLGRQTVRTKLSRASHTCLLSLCTTATQQLPSQSSQQQQQSSFDDGSCSRPKQEHASVLDIQAPTKMDRDLFANAFAQFLGINIITFEVEWDAEQQSVASPIPAIATGGSSTSNSKPSPEAVSPPATRALNHQKNNKSVISKKKMGTRTRQNNHNNNMNKTAVTSASSSHTNPIPPTTTTVTTTKSIPTSNDYKDTEPEHMKKKDAAVVATNSMSAQRPPIPTDNENNRILSDDNDIDDLSAVSSLTNHVDGEIVEELHCIIIGLKNELNAARAEANRAVKVAEQAIQSAESVHDSNNNHGGAGGSGGSDWNATVTHQAAKAAALAQKKSAAALSRARQAEESLAREQTVKLQLEKQSQVLQHRLRGLQAQLHFSSRSLSTTSFNNHKTYTNDKAFHEERCWRRKLLSNVLDTRGTARTYCALFPLPPSPPPSLSSNAKSKGDVKYTKEVRILQRVSPTAIYIEEESDSKSTNSVTGNDHDEEEVSNTAAGRYFNFDAVIGNDMEEVYEESVHPLLMDASSEGYSCVYFTVDASTSVNTHKNTLHPLSSLIKASMDTLLFSNNNKNEDVESGHWTVHMSILEVFNERLYDLLDGDNDAVSDQKQRKTKRLEMKTNNSGDVSVWNLARMELRTRSEVESCLLSLRTNFRGGHLVVSITTQRNKCTDANDALYAVGKMTFVHLARDRHPLTTKTAGLKHANANAVRDGGDHQQQSQLQLLNKSFVNLKHVVKLHADRRLRYDIDSEHADVFQNSSNVYHTNNRPSYNSSRANENIGMLNLKNSSSSKAAAGNNDSKSVPYRNATLTHLLKDVLHCGTEAMSTYCPEDHSPSSGYFLETDSANSLGYLSASRPHAKVAVLLLANTRYEMPIKRIMDGAEKDESEGRAPFTSGKELENILDFVDDFGRLSTKYLV